MVQTPLGFQQEPALRILWLACDFRLAVRTILLLRIPFFHVFEYSRMNHYRICSKQVTNKYYGTARTLTQRIINPTLRIPSTTSALLRTPSPSLRSSTRLSGIRESSMTSPCSPKTGPSRSYGHLVTRPAMAATLTMFLAGKAKGCRVR